MSGTITPDFVQKFSRVISLLASPHDGEVLAAAYRANRMLTEHGLSWQDVLRLGLAAPDDMRQPGKGMTWREQVDFCLQHRRGLNWKEIDFLLGLRGFDQPSPKQARWLAAIVAKVRRLQRGAA